MRPRTLSATDRWAAGALVGVGVLFAVLQHVLRGGVLGLSVDEANYLAKVDPEVPELYWSSVRAWGMPVLAAPVAAFSPGIEAVRLWFSLVSSAGLVSAFWPWRRLLHPAVAPLAALLLASTWFALTYGPQVMPNLYVALGAVATTGLFLRAAGAGRRVHLAALGAVAALVALVRPTDSLLLLAAVGVCALAVRRLRRPAPLAVLVVGVATGWVPWVVEAHQRFGGPLARLRGGSDSGLGGGISLDLTTLLTYPRVLDGDPVYCCFGEPAAQAGPVPLALTAWLLALPLLALGALPLAARARRLAETALPLACAAAFAGFYALLPFAGVRFLLPVVALLALPAAAVLVALVTAPSRVRPVHAVLAGGLVAAHLALMVPTAAEDFRTERATRAPALQIAAAVRPAVLARPCVVVSATPQVLSYYLGCRLQQLHPVRRRPPAAVRETLEQGGSVVAVVPGSARPGGWLATWRPVPVPGRRTAYLPPG